MRGGAKWYHTAELNAIQQHMTFEHTMEEKAKPTPKSEKNKKIEKQTNNGEK